MTTTITGATGVNQITDDAITAAKLPAGAVLQVGYVDSDTITTVTNTTTDILTLSITRRHANSFFILKTQLFVGMATSNGNQDGVDPSFGFQINNTRILQTVDSSHNDAVFMVQMYLHGLVQVRIMVGMKCIVTEVSVNLVYQEV